MSDDTEIPLLEDLVQVGEVEASEENSIHVFDELTDVEIEIDEPRHETTKHDPAKATGNEEDVSEDANIRELIIDEEIRMILDKHMDNAYEEIIRLLNHKIS